MPADTDLSQVLLLRPGIAVIPTGEAVQLRAGDEEIHLIETDSPVVVTQLLDGLIQGVTRNAMYASVADEDRQLVEELLAELDQRRLITERCESDEISRYLAHSPANASHRQQGLSAVRRVVVVGDAALGRMLVQAVTEHGMDCEYHGDSSLWDDSTPANVAVCAWQQPDLNAVMRFNRLVCERRVGCLFVDLSHGRHATIGPFYVPGDGACYECFFQRLRQNTAALAELDAARRQMVESGQPLPSFGCLPAFRYTVVGLATTEVFAYLVRHRPLTTLNRAATVDLDGMELWSEPAWRIPWCPVCGDATQ